jgi:hypothetical protein
MGSLARLRSQQVERRRRLEAARAALACLTRDERDELVAELCDEIESEADTASPNDLPSKPEAAATLELEVVAEASTEPAPVQSESSQLGNQEPSTPVQPLPPRKPPIRGTKKTDRAEALVWAHPDGITAAEVGKVIRQDPKTASSTLHQVAKTRGTIFWSHTRRAWRPAGEHCWTRPKTTLRDAITAALSAGTPLGTAGIVHAVKKALPDAAYPSVASEVMRMRVDKLIVERGRSGRGMLYGLASEATNRDGQPSDGMTDGGDQPVDLH